MTKLQFALDDNTKTITDAIRLLQTELIDTIDILEYGTPMFYRWGLEGLRQLRQAFPDIPLAVDLKLVDGAQRLVAMAADNGADYITVSGRAAEPVLQQSVKTAHWRGMKIMVDFSYVKEISSSLQFCQTIGVDAVCYGLEPLPDGSFSDRGLHTVLREKGPIDLAFAGGVNSENVSEIVRRYHPEILIVARGIAQAEQPVQAARIICRAMEAAT